MITQLDFNILNFIRQNITGPFMDSFMKTITHLGDYGFIWIVITIILLFNKKTRKMGICCGMSLILTLIIGNVIMKNLFARIRPFIEADIPIIISPPSGFSFPSGHTSSSFATAVSIALYNKKYAIPSILLAVLIGFSRIYLYVHYPSDVLAGAILGSVMAVIGYKISEKISKTTLL